MVLTIGIIASIGIMVAGFILFILGMNSGSIISFGAFILILTPIARVVTATLSFIQERDMRYFFITLSVLILILVSFIVGLLLAGFRIP